MPLSSLGWASFLPYFRDDKAIVHDAQPQVQTHPDLQSGEGVPSLDLDVGVERYRQAHDVGRLVQRDNGNRPIGSHRIQVDVAEQNLVWGLSCGVMLCPLFALLACAARLIFPSGPVRPIAAARPAQACYPGR